MLYKGFNFVIHLSNLYLQINCGLSVIIFLDKNGGLVNSMVIFGVSTSFLPQNLQNWELLSISFPQYLQYIILLLVIP